MPALIASLSMLQTLLLAALSVAREREQGTFDQLLVTPLTPMQILVGIWLAARRLHQGKFFWPGSRHGLQVELNDEQLRALVLGLPWQRVGQNSAISMM